MTTICATMAEAVADIPDGISLMVPGFGGTGMPWNLLTALYARGTTDLTTISNGVGAPSPAPDRRGIADFIVAGRVRKVIASFTAGRYPSQPSVAEEMVRAGRLEAELLPQGTLAERIRAAGAGIPAFYTPAGAGTLLAQGKEVRTFNGGQYVLETALAADYAFVHAWKADEAGNLVFRHAGRNFNPIVAMAARHTIVEVEEPIVPAGALAPDEIHTPGIYVERLVPIPADGIRHGRAQAAREPAPRTTTPAQGKRRLERDEIAAVIARRLKPGSVVNLGVGMPTLVSNATRDEENIVFTSENGVIGYSRLARPEEADPDVVNAGGQPVILRAGAAFVHHADSFALIRNGHLDLTVLGAYEAAADGSFANWRTTTAPFDELGGIGGAMDLASGAQDVWLAMEHTTRDGRPRLLERCALPITAPPGTVSLIVTDLGVIAVRGGRFVLEEHAPGYTAEEIAAATGAPLDISPNLREVAL